MHRSPLGSKPIGKEMRGFLIDLTLKILSNREIPLDRHFLIFMKDLLA